MREIMAPITVNVIKKFSGIAEEASEAITYYSDWWPSQNNHAYATELNWTEGLFQTCGQKTEQH